MIYWYIAAFVHYAIYGMINEEAQFTIRMIECSNIWAAATAVYSKVYKLFESGLLLIRYITTQY